MLLLLLLLFVLELLLMLVGRPQVMGIYEMCDLPSPGNPAQGLRDLSVPDTGAFPQLFLRFRFLLGECCFLVRPLWVTTTTTAPGRYISSGCFGASGVVATGRRFPLPMR